MDRENDIYRLCLRECKSKERQVCPKGEPKADSSCSGELSCEYGEETCCCGSCAPPKTYVCDGKKWHVMQAHLNCDCEECEENEEFDDCGTPCPKTCGKKPSFCQLRCTPGCFCKKGYVRNEKNWECVPEEKCPSERQVCPKSEPKADSS